MTDLKPCPFCGGEAVEGMSRIWCEKCGVETEREDDIEKAISVWNTRHVPEQEQPAPAESGGMLPDGNVSAALKALDWLAEMAEEAMHHHMQRDSVENAVAEVKAGLLHHAERNAVEVVTVEDLASAYEHLNTSTIWSLIDDKDIETIKKIFRNCGLEYV